MLFRVNSTTEQNQLCGLSIRPGLTNGNGSITLKMMIGPFVTYMYNAKRQGMISASNCEPAFVKDGVNNLKNRAAR